MPVANYGRIVRPCLTRWCGLTLDHALTAVDRSIGKIGGRLIERVHHAGMAGAPVLHVIQAIDRPDAAD